MANKYKANHSIKHLNGNIMCSIDTETTGLDCTYHEMIQLCVLPLTDDFLPDESIDPFVCLIKPQYPNRWDAEAAKVNGLEAQANKHGIDPFTALDMFHEWFERLPLAKTGTKPFTKQIIPLGQNFAFDYGFINAWMGTDEEGKPWFDYYFARRELRDLKIACTFLNDLAYMQNTEIPFPRTSLGALCDKLTVSHPNKHDALGDAEATARCYSRICSMRMPFGLDFGQAKFNMDSAPEHLKIRKDEVFDLLNDEL